MAKMKQGARKAPASTGKPMPAKDSSAVTPQMVRSKMSIPGNLQVPYEKVVLAAKKILYSPQLKPQVQALLKGPGTVGQKLGHGIVALMAIVQSQANNNLPPQLIIPVATEMVAEAGDFLRKAGMKVTDNDIAEGMSVMVGEIMQRSGLTPDKIKQALQANAQPGQARAQGGQPQVSPDGRPQMGV